MYIDSRSCGKVSVLVPACKQLTPGSEFGWTSNQLSLRLSSLMYLSFSGHMSGHVPTTASADVNDIGFTESAEEGEEGTRGGRTIYCSKKSLSQFSLFLISSSRVSRL